MIIFMAYLHFLPHVSILSSVNVNTVRKSKTRDECKWKQTTVDIKIFQLTVSKQSRNVFPSKFQNSETFEIALLESNLNRINCTKTSGTLLIGQRRCPINFCFAPYQKSPELKVLWSAHNFDSSMALGFLPTCSWKRKKVAPFFTCAGSFSRSRMKIKFYVCSCAGSSESYLDEQ